MLRTDPFSGPPRSGPNWTRRLRGLLTAVAVAALLCSSQPAQALTIVPTWDVTITSDPNAATIQKTINAAITLFQNTYSDPITVNIKFMTMNSGLGQSQYNVSQQTYSTYRAALQSDAKTADDATALAHLPAGPNNPVDNQPNMWFTFANLRAVGINPGPPSLGFDGVIALNTSICFLDRAHTVGAGPYDLQSVTEHEMDEVLGLGSGLNIPVAFPRYPRPQDLFRYDGSGNRSFSTTAATAWFSIDGTTNIVQFNQSAAGDYGDWIQNTPSQVQDWAATANQSPDLGPSEIRNLDVIGYDPIGAPAPSPSPSPGPGPSPNPGPGGGPVPIYNPGEGGFGGHKSGSEGGYSVTSAASGLLVTKKTLPPVKGKHVALGGPKTNPGSEANGPRLAGPFAQGQLAKIQGSEGGFAGQELTVYNIAYQQGHHASARQPSGTEGGTYAAGIVLAALGIVLLLRNLGAALPGSGGK